MRLQEVSKLSMRTVSNLASLLLVPQLPQDGRTGI